MRFLSQIALISAVLMFASCKKDGSPASAGTVSPTDQSKGRPGPGLGEDAKPVVFETPLMKCYTTDSSKTHSCQFFIKRDLSDDSLCFVTKGYLLFDTKTKKFSDQSTHEMFIAAKFEKEHGKMIYEDKVAIEQNNSSLKSSIEHSGFRSEATITDHDSTSFSIDNISKLVTGLNSNGTLAFTGTTSYPAQVDELCEKLNEITPSTRPTYNPMRRGIPQRIIDKTDEELNKTQRH